MPNILDKIFLDKKVELVTVKRKLSVQDVKTKIANNVFKIRDIKNFFNQVPVHLLLPKSSSALLLRVIF